MATIKQRKAAERMVENGGNASRAMREVGYSPATAQNPKKLTESKGFLELCDELGLTDDLIVNALVADIKNKPKNRKAELELAAKMRGRLAAESSVTVVTPIQVLINEYKLKENNEGEGEVT